MRVAVAATMSMGDVIHHLDVKTAFLNGELRRDENIYIHPPAGLDLGLRPGQALKLNKALYGLKEAPRIWDRTLDAALKKLGFKKLRSDECFYIFQAHGTAICVLVYVDDVLIIAKDDVGAACIGQEHFNE